MEIEEIIPYYFSKNPVLRWLFRKRLSIGANLAEEKLSTRKPARAVDIGFGQGLLFDLLNAYPQNIELHGLEVEEDARQVAKTFPRVNIKIADLRNTGYESKFFDVVFALDVIEHFKNLAEPVGEIRRILKDDGHFIISIPTESAFYKLGRFLITGTTSMETAPCSPHYHRAKDIEKFLKANGFVEVKKIFLPPISFLSLFHIILLKKS